MTKQTIIAAYRTQIYFHRIFLLCPLRFNNNGDLSNGWLQIVYTYCVLFIFVTFTILLTLATDLTSDYYTANGRVWLIFGLTEFFLSKIAFVVIVIIAERKKHQQVSFFNSIAQLDRLLQKEFNISTNYAIYRRVNLCAIFIIICYFGASTFDIGRRLFSFGNFRGIKLPAMALPLLLELCVFAMIVTIYINGVMLIGDKFSIVKKLMQSKYVQNTDKLHKLMYVYIELFKVITIWNDYIGWIMMMRLTHDFTASTTVSYLLFATLMDNSGTSSNIFNITVLLSQNVIRIVLVTVFAEHAITKVGAKTN